MTRSILLGAIVSMGVITVLITGQQQESPRLTVERLADNLHVIKDQNDGNTLVFIRAAGVVLVDSKSLRAAPLLLEQVRRITDKPVTHILNTHHHFDHVGGNPSFAASVEVVAHENAAGRMTSMTEFSTPERKHGLPDRTFTDRLTLFPGPDAIDLHYFGPAHTDGDAFIVFRSLGVMHAGDTFPGVNVVARHGGSAEAYPTTMSRAASTITGVRTVVPGHGSLKTWQEFTDSATAPQKGAIGQPQNAVGRSACRPRKSEYVAPAWRSRLGSPARHRGADGAPESGDCVGAVSPRAFKKNAI